MRLRLALLAALPAACLLLGWPALNSSEILKKHNTLAEIDRAAGKIEMKLVREWGGENETDPKKMLYEPKDVACDRDGNYYLLEGLKILVFDKHGKFIKQIGGPGLGPGEFLGAVYIDIDSGRNLAVYDSINQRIQILKSDGSILGNVSLSMYQSGPFLLTNRSEILLANTAKTTATSVLWQYYNFMGELVRETGSRLSAKSALITNSRYAYKIAKDNADKIFAAAVYQPLISVYSGSGQVDEEISYELPFTVPELKPFIREGQEFIDKEMICQGIAVDSKMRILVLTHRRIMALEERKIGMSIAVMGGTGGGISRTPVKSNVDPSISDLYQILVFDASGKIVSSNKLDFYANQIRIFGNRLFLIDSYINMNVREYLLTN